MPDNAQSASLYQRAQMLTYHALDLLKRRTGLTNARLVTLIAHWYTSPSRDHLGYVALRRF